MHLIRSTTIVLARFFMTAMFLERGLHKVFYWHDSETKMMNVFSHWQMNLSFSESAQHFFSTLIQFTPLILFIVGTIEIIGGLLVLLAVREKLGATLLLIMMMPTTILFHEFWFTDVACRELQQLFFLKNLAVMGGLLLILVYGVKSSDRDSGGFL
jgi:putative oxidoreductase